MGFWVAHLLHVMLASDSRSRSDLAFAGNGDDIGQRVYLHGDLLCIEKSSQGKSERAVPSLRKLRLFDPVGEVLI